MNDKLAEAFVPETLIGKHFPRSKTWTNKVLEIALQDLVRLLGRDDLRFPVVADVGCGYGRSLKKLNDRFHPLRLIYQDEAIQEYFRVLKPGGVLLFAESTKRYIDSWIIRLFFRHPMSVQKTADEYIALIRGAGFSVLERQISYPYLWWSREDFAILENCLVSTHRKFARKP